jgi:probable rRNA maturation factor
LRVGGWEIKRLLTVGCTPPPLPLILLSPSLPIYAIIEVRMEINVLIDEPLETGLEPGWLEGITRQVLEAQGAGAEAEVSLLIATGERVKELNREYLGEDEPTDVLAFSAREEGAGQPPFIHPPDGLLHLGEVIIAYPQAVIQAAEHGHPVKKELAILLIHGLLHLLGYDHDEPEGERRMKSREAELLSYLEGGLK